jgi:hypothetical protein
MSEFIIQLAEFDDDRIQFARTAKMKGQLMKGKRMQYLIQDQQILECITRYSSIDDYNQMRLFLEEIGNCVQRFCRALSEPKSKAGI